jgi:hypothetical protein
MAKVHFGDNINKDIKVKKVKDPELQAMRDAMVEPPVVEPVVEKQKSVKVVVEEPRCLACKRTATECGYSETTTPIWTLHTHYLDKFICEKCWEKAGYPLGSGEELMHRVLIILDIPME